MGYKLSLKFKWSAVAAVVLALLFVLAAGARALAADAPKTQITITPTKVAVELQPGARFDGEYTVINSGDENTTVKVFASSYSVVGDDYDLKYDTTTWSRSLLAKWVTYDEDEFFLRPGERQVVRYHIAVPNDVPAGGQYAMLMTEIEPDPAVAQGAAVITKKRIGLSVLGHVAGETRRSGQVVSSTAAFWQQGAPLTAAVRVKNTGNIDFASTTTLRVDGLFGGKRYEAKATPLDILPDTTRVNNLAWPNAPWGIYRVTLTTKFLDQTVTAHHVVIVFPIWLLIIILLMLAALIVYLRQRRRSKRMAIKNPARKN